MSERYSYLFRLPENLYAEGAPVLIAAGALLKDNQTGNIIAQLKLKNIVEKHIKAVKVLIDPMDSVNRPIGEEFAFDYLDLDVRQDEAFGQKTPIRVSDTSARAYAAKVAEVSFADNSVWSASGAPWEALASQEPLSVAYQDTELVKQFQLEYGDCAVMQPKRDRDLWLCYCGAVNRAGEALCHVCGSDPNYDPDALNEKKQRRLADEKAEAERKAAKEAAAKAAAEAKAKKTKKLLAILLPAAAVVIAAVLLLTLVVLPNKRYNDALALGEAGRYDEAIAALEAMDGYKDSAAEIIRLQTEQKNTAAYAEAEALLAAKDYDGAIRSFLALGDYRDSAQRVEEAEELKHSAQYAEAEALLASGDYDGAIKAFTLLGDYRDSAQRAEETAELKHSVQYAEAEALLASEDYDGAIEAFTLLGDYRDSADRVGEATEMKLCSLYTQALKYEEQGEYGTAITAFRKVLDYSDSRAHVANLVSKMQGCISIESCEGSDSILALHNDGTVSYSGLWDDPEYKQYMNGDFTTWKEIISVSCGMFELGLRSDGTVSVVGGNWPNALSHISSWKNIVAISSHGNHAVGLRNDGTVVAELTYERLIDKSCVDVAKWNDIVAVSAGWCYTVGLKADGTVVSTKESLLDFSDWSDIVAISAGSFSHALGLRADGTVVATGTNSLGECNVNSWSDIVAISAGAHCSMGLKADGTVVVAGGGTKGLHDFYEFNVSDWHDIVAISAGDECVTGVCADGSVVLVNIDSYYDKYLSPAAEWTNIGRKG